MGITEVIEITFDSKTSFEDAVREGVARASETVEEVRSCWIEDQEVVVQDGEVVSWHVTMKVTSVLGS